jgi:BirA family biotin operon repressor/biotin-[acetyl-CoA-carboxylase] ligase
MKLIKLGAIDSTNDYLKSLSSKNVLENFTVITAQSQHKGRGQMGASWISEAGKNLIMSVLVKDVLKKGILEKDCIFGFTQSTKKHIKSQINT